jgi:hypothetical protein
LHLSIKYITITFFSIAIKRVLFNVGVEGSKSAYDTKHDYLHLFSYSSLEFKHNLTNKNIISKIINQIIDCFCFKSRLNNIPMNTSFVSIEFGLVPPFSIKRSHKILAELDEEKEHGVQIFYDLKNYFVTRKI